MPIYSLYHLLIDSEFPLPELAEATGMVDVRIRRGTIAGFEDWPLQEAGRRIQVTGDQIGIFWEHVGACLIQGGTTVVTHFLPGIEDELVRLCLLGPVIALLMHQRGATVLHASCCDVDGRGVALIGEKGWGKSTLAAMMHNLGCPLICDDLAVLHSAGGRLLIESGLPLVKLWPESVAALGEQSDELPRLYSQVEKRHHRLERPGGLAPVPLAAILMLEWGPELALEPLKSFAALRALAPHWYGARFGTPVLESLGLKTHFLQCSRLVREVPCARLVRPAQLDRLADSARLVQDYVGRLASTPQEPLASALGARQGGR